MPPRRAIRTNAKLLSPEAWMRVCMELDETPRKVFMLICAVKGLSAWLTDAWWESYWTAHQRHLVRKRYAPHWYMRTDTLGQMRPQMYKPILRLVYGLQCSVCGCRYRHRINNQLKKRVCRDCTQEQHISNTVLYFEYGISFAKVIEDIEPFVRYIPLREFSPSEIPKLSRHPLDLACTGKRFAVFFWLPDIKRLYDMPALRQEQLERVAKVNHLKAAFKRSYAQRTCSRYHVELLHRNEVARATKPLAAGSWLAGGPCKARSRSSLIPHQEQVDLRNIKARMRLWRPIPILGDQEYVLKTAMCKLNLDASTLDASQWQIPAFHRTPYVQRIYTIGEHD